MRSNSMVFSSPETIEYMFYLYEMVKDVNSIKLAGSVLIQTNVPLIEIP